MFIEGSQTHCHHIDPILRILISNTPDIIWLTYFYAFELHITLVSFNSSTSNHISHSIFQTWGISTRVHWSKRQLPGAEFLPQRLLSTRRKWTALQGLYKQIWSPYLARRVYRVTLRKQKDGGEQEEEKWYIKRDQCFCEDSSSPLGVLATENMAEYCL